MWLTRGTALDTLFKGAPLSRKNHDGKKIHCVLGERHPGVCSCVEPGLPIGLELVIMKASDRSNV